MSISGALSSALTGLTTQARSAELVSNNVANATTEGYGRRTLELSAGLVGDQAAGVRVDGVSRQGDPVLLGDRRAADASNAGAGLTTGFLDRMERALGLPGAPGALTDRLANFEAALIAAASRPDSTLRLQAAAEAADSVAVRLNQLSATVQDERMRADRAIAAEVETLNTTLAKVADLNDRIVRLGAARQDASALVDQRQVLIDRIAEIVPVREVARDGGRVALFSPGGAILLDVRPARIGFTPAGVITPDMTLASGALSPLTINGTAIDSDAGSSRIAGGRLAALFEIRDTIAPAEQTRLDALARDLTERLADPAVDPSLGVGDPGLFTDAGAGFDAPNEIGFAGRIALNAALDPAGSGVWRLRDGIGAAAPGDAGNATLLHALHDALTVPRTPVSGGFSGVARSASGLAADLVSAVSVARQSAEADRAFAGAEAEALRAMELRLGVDTDQEMQDLLKIEKAYAANARVLSAVDELLATLLGI